MPYLNCSVQQRATRSSRTDAVTLKPHVILKVQGDGNCLYRSLSQLAFNTEHYFESIKKCILAFVQQQKNEGLFTKLAQDFEGRKFVPLELVRKRVISSSCWGTHENIFICATLLQSPILVYCSSITKWVQFNPLSANDVCLSVNEQCVLHLINHDNTHYDAVNPQIGAILYSMDGVECNISLPQPLTAWQLTLMVVFYTLMVLLYTLVALLYTIVVLLVHHHGAIVHPHGIHTLTKYTPSWCRVLCRLQRTTILE